MLLLGTRFAIVNTEEEAEVPSDRLVINVTPSHSYGHGWGDDTAKMLEVVERRVQAGDRVLDVGTGVGTLAFAALLLGASHATVTELDPEALRALRRNVVANGVEDRVTIVEGTLPDTDEFDVVLCNIGAWEHTQPHFDNLARRAKRAFVFSAESTQRKTIAARAARHKLNLMGVVWAFNLNRAHDPTAPDWTIQELVR